MAVLGKNILNLALRVIGTDCVWYRQYASKSTNSIGYDVPVYNTPVKITGSLQPVNRSAYVYNGLDFSKDYFIFYSSTEINDLVRDQTPDQLIYGGFLFEVISNNDWKKPQGYNGVMAIKLGPFSQFSSDFSDEFLKELGNVF